MEDIEEIEGLEPEIEPEICGEGVNDTDCEPHWNYEQQVWVCLTCGKHL